MSPTLRVRWLGSVPYADAHALQRGLFAAAAAPGVDRPDDWLLLLEHPHVYTLGVRADLGNLLVPPAEVGADLVRADRGGDVTYHGPGQLVGYPILSVPGKRGGGMADTAAYVRGVEQVVIDALADLGLPGAGRLRGFPGVWIDPGGDRPRKIAAVGVRLSRGRSMHGFALNVDPDLAFFDHIVPCGIADKAVTSMAAEGVEVTMGQVVDAVVARAVERWSPEPEAVPRQVGAEPIDAGTSTGGWERHDVVWRHRPDDLSPFRRGAGPSGPVPVRIDTTARRRARLTEAGVDQGLTVAERKPSWLRAPARLGPEYLALKRTVRDTGLVTVCEEAGCPNIFDCWADGTATFMLNGDRCTRACGFCLVDTRHPEPVDADEPERVAEAVARMGLGFAVLTAVARDDLADGGATGFAESIRAIRRRSPGTSVEVLIPDCKGDADALQIVFDARPDVLNHNVETVARLQRAVRPSAGHARSLAVLARAKAAGLTTKSGIIVGLGETADEVGATLADLAGVGVDIVTVGQYLRPTADHLPVARWWAPDEFDELKRVGEALGIGHVEASPLTRSSYHARQAADAASVGSLGVEPAVG
jgi:lipoic acid synthetase